ncbi:MAG: nucleotidyltransferase family protein [Litorimonas sp.]
MSLRAIILAGQRPGPDALCDHAGVAYKADIPIRGIAMVERVATALRDAGISEPFALSGYAETKAGFKIVEGGRGPADSALMAASEGPYPILLTTCDHALLTSAMVEHFVTQSQVSGADFTVGLATETVIQAAYPTTKRTYLRFADHAVSGCNLFYLANDNALEAIRFWRVAQDFRKDPLKLARTVGLGLGVKYASGRLTLHGAFEAVSKKLDMSAMPILLPFAEAAIDVDKPSDLVLVEKILAARD